MNFRSLPMLNAIGCLFLAVVVFLQWGKESTTQTELGRLRVEASAAHELAESESRRAANLERDIEVLKESFETTRRTMAIRQRSLDAANEGEKARTQIEIWKDAVTRRDERIKTLEGELLATRRRLDEAVVRLRQAGVR